MSHVDPFSESQLILISKPDLQCSSSQNPCYHLTFIPSLPIVNREHNFNKNCLLLLIFPPLLVLSPQISIYFHLRAFLSRLQTKVLLVYQSSVMVSAYYTCCDYVSEFLCVFCVKLFTKRLTAYHLQICTNYMLVIAYGENDLFVA